VNRRGFLKNLLLGVGAAVAVPILATMPVAPPVPVDPAILRQQAKAANFALAYGNPTGYLRMAEYDIMEDVSARARNEIMAEEDKRFFEILNKMTA